MHLPVDWARRKMKTRNDLATWSRSTSTNHTTGPGTSLLDELDQNDAVCREFHVVGIGASAGGLEALEDFFEHMPTDLGVAFVVVQHLSPDFKSHMEQLLARKTKLPIAKAEHEQQVEPNHVYLIPPKKEMTISEGRLLLTDRSSDFSHPIDQFLRALATDVGRYSIGVILSGTGSDGSRGVREISSGGGLVIAQDEVSAKFDGMPVNAAATGGVDLVLRPDQMGEVLTQYVKEGLTTDALSERELFASATGIEKIFSALKEHTGVDFSYYKASTIGRRIQRRMSMERIEDVEDYYQRLVDDRQELDDLYYDLLIGVTKFFRDAEAFHELRDNVIPDLFAKDPGGDPVRVWVSACATGEEAYTIAILLEEYRRKHEIKQDYKLFATDVHKTALQRAALAVYPPEALEDLPRELIHRYFRERKGEFHVAKGLRRKIVFAPHNVFQDAPFTQLDLVTCRNMLIYLQPQAQKKTLSLFHFSLKAGGVLFLGPSETPGDLLDEFQVLNKRWRIYRKRRDVRLPIEPRTPFRNVPSQSPQGGNRGVGAGRANDIVYLGTYERLLAENMPPSILIDEHYDLLHTFGGAERFLRHRGGKHSSNLLDIVDEQLRTPIAGALTHAMKDDTEVKYSGIRLREDNSQEQIRLVVRPVHDHVAKLTTVLVQFHPLVVETLGEDDDESSVDMATLSEERIGSLETELRFTRENLQATIEELETSNEELQATNEEMIASNEELQSTNEELQSVNEELYTVNVEHQKRIDELAEATNDMDNLLATTRVGVIYIDDELCLRRYTPEIGRLFHLLPQDIGRPIASFQSNLQYDEFESDVREVLEKEKEIERAVSDRTGTPFLVRMMPYRTTSSVTGVVMTLIDVTALNKAQQAVERFQHMTEASSDVHAFLDEMGRIIYSNPSLTKASGKDADELKKMTWRDLDAEMSEERFNELILKSRSGTLPPYQWKLVGPDGTKQLEVAITGRQIGGKWIIFAIGRDITEREAERLELIETQKAAVAASEAKSSFLANMSHEIRTPLAAILGFAEIIETTCQEPTQIENARTIRRNGEHLLSVVNDVLDLSKIEARKMDFDFKVVQTSDLFDDIYALMRIRADAKALDFWVRYETEVPERIRTDPVRFRQIMLNLVGNAIKFTEAGSVTISVRYETPVLVVSVIDTGIGMSSDEVEELFEPFAQSPSTVDNRLGGTGLGLSICRRLCAALKGEISAVGQPGVGSTFTIRMPVGDVSDVPMVTLDHGRTSANNESTDPDTTADLTGRTILVADDRRDVWKVAETFLTRAGADVVIAVDGSEAVDIVQQADESKFDLIFMDMQMPIMNGYDAVRKLRELGYKMPIVTLTAAAMKGERGEAMDAGSNAYLTKPINAKLLVSTAARLIEEHGG